MIEINKDIVKQTINKYGKQLQSIVCMEECSELIQAIAKAERGNVDRMNITEEISDVLISIDILKQIYSISDIQIQEMIDYKQHRIQERMRAE